jgi:hypothetical protein
MGDKPEDRGRYIKVTTQRGVRYSVNPLHQRWQTRQSHLCYPFLNTTVYSDTMFVKSRTRAGIGGAKKCAQVFTTTFDHLKFYPMRSKAQSGHKLDKFVHDVGVMKHLHTDGTKEEYDAVWGMTIKYHHIHPTVTEPYNSNQNRAEIAIRDLRWAIRHHSKRKAAPFWLWNLAPWNANIKSCTASVLPQMNRRTPLEVTSRSTPDISDLTLHNWYEYVWYWDPADPEPAQKEKLGRWLGVAHRVGQDLSYWIITAKCSFIAWSTIRPVNDNETSTEHFLKSRDTLDRTIKSNIGDCLETPDPSVDVIPNEIFKDYKDDFDLDPWMPDLIGKRQKITVLKRQINS